MRRRYIVEWAGYGPDGNDRRGHMHVHPDGPHERHDGLRGFLCVAPIEDGRCTDPTPRYLAAKEPTNA